MIPLVGPLEDGLLLVPAQVNGKGPFVFAIDPDAHVSIVDADVVKATGAATGEGPKMLDESDTERSRFYAEILSWQIGTLKVAGPKPAQIVPPGTFDAGGRRIHGVLGRDIIADSLVLRFDRDDGTVMLSTQKGFAPAKDATAIPYAKLTSQVQNAEIVPVPRRLVRATIGGQQFALHVDLGATPSQLRARSWTKAKLVESELQLGLVDEAGMVREVKKQGVANAVSVGGVTTSDVVFVPYDDKRWPDQNIEGTLGLGFFKPYVVAVNWDSNTLYVNERKRLAHVATRLGRWQSRTLTSCPNPGCVKISLVDPLAGKPPEQMPEKHPGLVASIVRESQATKLDLEVLVAVTPAAGKGPLKWLVANFPVGTDRAMTHLPADYVGATLTVLDAGLFPRACPGAGACIDLLTPPQPFVPSATAERQILSPNVVKRRAGEILITPDDEDKPGLDGKTLRLSAKVCVDTAGEIEDVTIIERSGVDNYDRKAERVIRGTWHYEPYIFDGKVIPFCTAATIIYTQK